MNAPDQPGSLEASFDQLAKDYCARLQKAIGLIPIDACGILAQALLRAWKQKKQVFLFGNGGSAANANHLANDFIYGISKNFGSGLRISALSANSAVLTCLANDEGYENIYVHQLAVLANAGDVVIALSGSGNSPNIVKALNWCRDNGIESFAVLGYSGGKAKALAGCPIHIPVDDMQISEDLQLVIGHMVMQWCFLNRNRIILDTSLDSLRSL
jgi:D-sedoheptulose 7-phosphate isomerase